MYIRVVTVRVVTGVILGYGKENGNYHNGSKKGFRVAGLRVWGFRGLGLRDVGFAGFEVLSYFGGVGGGGG